MVLQSKTTIIIIMVVFFIGCGGKKNLYPSQYLRWMNTESNGLVNKKEVDGLIYEMEYVSPEWMTLNELKTTQPVKADYERARKRYGQMEYVLFKIYDKPGTGVRSLLEKRGIDPDQVEYYFNYQAAHDFRMIAGKDTFPSALYAFSKTYGVSKEFAFEMAFAVPDSDRTNDNRVEWSDGAMGNGLMKFGFSSSDIKNIPGLKL